MKLLIDANILLDVLQDREPHARASATRLHADYIITRNIKDFSESQIPAMTPAEFLDRL